jgi:hypothetical protein
MDAAAYGQLIYLLQRLKTEAARSLPTQHNVQHRFIEDVQELENYDCSPREKEKLLRLIRTKYLSPEQRSK